MRNDIQIDSTAATLPQCRNASARLLAALVLSAAALPAAAADSWTGSDKAAHLGVSFSLGAIGAQIASTGREPDRAPLYGAAVGVLPGLLKELADSRASNNGFSGKDMVANIVGAAVGAAFGGRVFILPAGHSDGGVNGVMMGISQPF